MKHLSPLSTLFSIISTPGTNSILKLLGVVLIWGNKVFSIFTNLKVCKYAEHELCHKCFSKNFLKILKITFSKNTAGRTLLILCDCSLKISRMTFNPLMPSGNKKSYILKQNLQLRLAGLFKYVCPFVTNSIKRLKNTTGSILHWLSPHIHWKKLVKVACCKFRQSA